ncbi:MAG: hypothetical protein IPN72_05090 [Saprospiraceae bacterium]|nr:hypothetical protein [Saprospiraceae bacterium]
MNVSAAKQTLYFLLAFMSLWGCAGKSILVANFETDVIGQSPATAQKVGTVRIDGPVHNCTVEKIANMPGKWVKITRPNNPAIVDGLQGVASESKGDGKYVLQVPFTFLIKVVLLPCNLKPITNQPLSMRVFTY